MDKHARAPGKIDYLVRGIEAAAKAVEFHAGDKLDNAVRAHTALTAHRLGESKVLEEGLKAGWLKIVGARYDLDSGKVEVVTS
jgi:carbonic anhydrase